MKKKIVFYSILYNIKSKFNFDKYINWLKIFVETLIDFEIVIFTNKKTYGSIEENIQGYFNVSLKIKELEDFELFQYKNIFENNTNKKYFPHHDISFELILLWVNRHLLISEVKDIYYADYYCFLDIGYFRDGIIKNIDINFANKLEDKIYIALVKNELPYLKQIVNVINSKDKNLIEETLINNYYLVGGGFTIIPDNLIEIWTKIFREELTFFIENNIDFKDDQTLIREISFNKKNINYFKFLTSMSKGRLNGYKNITEKNNIKDLTKYLYYNELLEKYQKLTKNFDDWFPFIFLLNGNHAILNFNDNIKYLLYDWILTNKIPEDSTKLVENTMVKIYTNYKEKIIFIYLNCNSDLITEENIENLLFFHNCKIIYVNKEFQNNNIIKQISEIFDIKITIK